VPRFQSNNKHLSLGDPRSLSDDDLLGRLSELLRQSRCVESDLVAHIGEVDQRRLYAREASPSMFAYCTDVLHLSEHEAYLRITVARAAREHPTLLEMLDDGRLHLSGIAKLVPHLTNANRESVLARASHRSKRQIEELVAELAPRPDVPAVIRRLPQSRSAEDLPIEAGAALLVPTIELGPDRAVPQPAPPPPAVVEPLAPARYKVQFTASAEFCEKLERLRALMRHSLPDGDLAVLLEIAVTEKLQRVEARRFGVTKRPKQAGTPAAAISPTTAKSGQRSRYVVAAVRRTVHVRDDGRCQYVAGSGRQCETREWAQQHHVIGWARGGESSVDNIHEMCRTHNMYLAERDYGKRLMAKYRRRSPKAPVGDSAAPDAGPRLIGRIMRS
jgi:hypothetical protein